MEVNNLYIPLKAPVRAFERYKGCRIKEKTAPKTMPSWKRRLNLYILITPDGRCGQKLQQKVIKKCEKIRYTRANNTNRINCLQRIV